MDYRIGKMKKVKKKVKMMLKDLVRGIKGLIFATGMAFITLIYLIMFLLLEENPKLQLFTQILVSSFNVILGTLFGMYVKELESKRKIRELKPAILLELKYVLISLIQNFTRFYKVYFELLKFDDLSRLFELIEKRKKDFPNYLIDELSPSMILYDFHEIYQEYIKKITLEVKKMAEKLNQEDIERIIEKSKEKSSLQDILNSFHSLLETYKEIKPAIKPIHMTLLSSLLNNLSVFDKDFAENIFYIWYEINELNRETEVLKELSRTDPSLIRSISQRIERIAIKIDEILEKEGTNL